jgi:hypothetical protein
MTSRPTTVAPDAAIQLPVPTFARGVAPIGCAGDRFVSRITRIDVVNFLRQRSR